MIAPLVMIGSGLVALVAVGGWWREIVQRADAGCIAWEMQDRFLAACEREYELQQRVGALQDEIDAGARKLSDASKKGWAGRKERERACTEATRLAIEASAREAA